MEAFGALSIPKSPRVRLARTVKHYFPASGSSLHLTDNYGVGMAANFRSGPLHVPAPQRNSGKGAKGVMVGADGTRDVGGARFETLCRWWVPPGDLGDVMLEETLDDTIRFTKYLEGEIHLEPDLAPTSHATIFSIQVSISQHYFDGALIYF